MKIKVIDQTSGAEERGEGEYARWGRDTYHSIQGIKKASNKEYSDFESSFEPEPDITYFLLYVLYTDGNSFGKSTGNIEFVDLYRDRDVAKKAAEAIKDHAEANENKRDRNLTIPLDCGEDHAIYPPWIGYFNEIEDIIIAPVSLLSEERSCGKYSYQR